MCLISASCGGVEPFDYTPIDSIPPGPGLFSGVDGVFTIGLGDPPAPPVPRPNHPEDGEQN